ncbi:glycine cleavage system protein GcvH [Agrococcus sediminis]|jgi:glycine cleavage system H protein|uniref:Glycine cleavage system H protein n=1 Tax=Agrococcus sediminis TaxID=2599924 RepID=A0A5M8QCQ3_9MICO|nr:MULTISPECIES: glycine cleavage system protein GcvH [Agrococcus]KAA6432938.1 glycine cleavage system protein GcvH [Agrococcus sediminis]MDR7234213.1 glycine cleavage system H protein [Agrococcus sp. BE272]UOW00976.1 glycine cleavage system protein GcvH [Agrococcus sp. SCSIO52902]
MSETKYTADHEWIRVEGDTATIGITDYAQAALGDVVFVDLPGVGRSFAAGEAIGEIESTKSVGELLAPAAGEVLEVNDEVAGDPTLVNSAAEGAGWLVKVRFSEEPELLDEAAYRELTA